MTSEVVMELKNSLPRIKKVDRLVAVDRDFEFLRRVPLFARLSLDELRYVQSMCEKVTFPAGSYLIRQGRPGEMLYVLVRGKVEVSSTAPGGKRTKLVVLGPGAHVGEMSLLDDAPTSADIVAIEPVLAFCLSRHRFQELIHGNERIQLGIYSVMVKSLAKRLREANTQLAEAGR
jgi:CRP-like cAMP-binding protein